MRGEKAAFARHLSCCITAKPQIGIPNVAGTHFYGMPTIRHVTAFDPGFDDKENSQSAI